MKTKFYFSFLAVFAFLLMAPQAHALPTTATVTSPATEVEEMTFSERVNYNKIKRKQKRNKRIMKMIVKSEKFVQKLTKGTAIDFKDEVMKWLWYAVFAYAGSILFYILSFVGLGFFSWIAAILSVAASVFIVIWFLKYFELA